MGAVALASRLLEASSRGRPADGLDHAAIRNLVGAVPSVTVVLTVALVAIGWTIRGAFAKAHLAVLTAGIDSEEQLIALLKEQQQHAAKKAEELRRQIVAIRARPEAKYTLAASLDQAETSATEATAAVLEMGATLAEVVLRTHAR